MSGNGTGMKEFVRGLKSVALPPSCSMLSAEDAKSATRALAVHVHMCVCVCVFHTYMYAIDVYNYIQA